ncbi:MAG: TatD family hydrolase [Acidobacteria bacterium]|nr:TatD family hydrolase [Acidobacteriota bacterium]
MTLIDSHCHLDSYDDLRVVLSNAKNAGVAVLLAIGIGDGPETMGRALEIAKEVADGGGDSPRIFASVGIHPQEALQATPEALAKMAGLAADPMCIAVGEIGLDYYHEQNPEAGVQKEAFVAQMRIAASVGKAIIIHCRTSELATPAAKARFEGSDAWEDLLELIAEHWTATGLPGIMHCFSGNEEQAARSLEAGFYLSFAGNLTYPKSVTIQAVAASAPANRILVETDAPFLAPTPLRGQRNEPAFVGHTARFLAKLRGVSEEEIAACTTANFRALFEAVLS